MVAGRAGKRRIRTDLTVTESCEADIMNRTSDLKSELANLLSEPAAAAAERARDAFDNLVGSAGETLVLHGAGNLGRRTVVRLRAIGIEPLAFCDNNPALWGSKVEGVDVLAPD